MATSLRMYLDATSQASELVLGLYGERGGEPGALLAAGRIDGPLAGALERRVARARGVALVDGTPYWIGAAEPGRLGRAAALARPRRRRGDGASA